MEGKAQHYAILVVDIEKFGSRGNPTQATLRKRMYELLEHALDEAGIDHRAEPRPVDRGDGVFWLLPGSVPKTELTGRFVYLLQAALRAHARHSSADAALRLRAALHYGEVAWDGRGWVGEDLNTACRIVDFQPLRDALGAGTRSALALAVSDPWYRAVVRHDYPEIDSRTYQAVRFDAKEIKGSKVWIRVPGYDTPPGIEPFVADEDPGTPVGAEGEGTAPGNPGKNHNLVNAQVQAQQVVAGDQIVNGSLQFGTWPGPGSATGDR
ncbi:aromatic ring-opening dioxygenase LigA [Streptomyces noursei ZPM]|uniref:Guanylate cyclase domain-containing protein n=1 Tax=Streptomyces noursei TaxID=1971 RepID=A0A401QXN9_STRNR|nr:hypothetical protein [Streptomyces noursei]AKA02845.1 aromatic ring-opening dioxygenase LigA [Streptomyces noursei ZPM]EOT04886.1 hypothetical protein K530_06255 [Streptomyces noursei CCRC 11814]EXU88578.1 hypothetical protein P354_28325 [Streptomyces noursei PD-1]UWS71351.1 hypothetical protein N1H47_08930 [Streptomyces noursei]GCB90161.1 hypothetical protein SALB_02863 [Streptomyces noursei]